MSDGRKENGSKVGSPRVRLTPLSFAIRLDIPIPTGRKGPVTASRMAWITPSGKKRWVEGLEAQPFHMF